MDINELVKEYKDLMEREAELKAEKESLKAQIVEAIGSEKKIVTPDGLTATLADKVTTSYSDEFAIIRRLKKMRLDNYVVEVINKTAFNKALKAQESLNESFKDLISYQTSTSLTIK